jgi:hypothetical protein
MNIPTFGTKLPGRPYQTRPGAYAVIQNADGQIAMVKTKRGQYSFLHFEYIEEQWDEFERRRQL